MKAIFTFSIAFCLYVGLFAQVPQLLKDINPGWEPSTYTSNLKNYAIYNGKLYFSANAGNTTTGHELWVTDGTASGTVMVKDINPGSSSSSPQNFHVVNGYLMFVASGSGTGAELWRSDGTAAGTVLVKDIAPGSANGILNFNNPLYESAVWNDVLYFEGNDGTTGPELWRSDGTENGTYLVKDINPAFNPNSKGSYPSYFTAYNGKLYFAAQDSIIGRELWVTDGTGAGTHLVKDISTDFLGSTPSDMVSCNGYLLFIANSGFNSGGVELFRTDGTAAGTVMVKDIYPGFNNGLSASLTAQTELKLAKVGEKIFFSANSSAGKELWMSDGTEQGTQMVLDASTSNSTEGAMNFGVIGNILYYRFEDGVHGKELWRSDGTASGTYLVKDINNGTANGFTFTTNLTTYNGYVFFNATDGISGDELWKSDGTSNGTTLVGDLTPGASGCQPHQFSGMNNIFFFVADTPLEGAEYWTLAVDLFVPLEVSLFQSTDVSCNGGSDGELSVSVMGGTAPYTYSWTPALGDVSNPTGLSAGSYSVIVTDVNGAMTAATFEITEPTALITNTSSIPATYNNANGSASVSTSGGTPSYSFLWSNGVTTANNANIVAGDYTVTVTDANGCTATSSVTVDMETATKETFASSLVISPTLSNGWFTVLGSDKAEFTGLDITLTDSRGGLVKQWSNVSTGQLLSVDNQPANGLYYISITYKHETAIKKVVFME